MVNNYNAYHVHTSRSLLDSCTSAHAYIDRAVEIHQNAIAFTEHGNIYNWVEKKLYCDEKGIKYIHGVECYLTASSDFNNKVRDNYHTILLAKNFKGVQEINTLIDISTNEDHFYYKPRITFEEFFNISDNVIKISACLASPLNKYMSTVPAIRKEIDCINNKIEHMNTPEYKEEIRIEFLSNSGDIENFEYWYSSEHYPEEFSNLKKQTDDLIGRAKEIKNNYVKLLSTYDYYEIQAHNSPDQIAYNKMLYKLSKEFNKPLIAGTDTHSISKYKAECRSILQKAKGIEYDTEDVFDLTYKTYDELVEMFKIQDSVPEEVFMNAINNTVVMADSVEDFELDKSFKYPKLYDDEEAVLKTRIIRMLQEKINNGIINDDPRYKENIIEEFKVFKKINMVGFMLFMSELMTWCWDNDIPIGFCRGSVGGSTIAYITDIIDVDPIVWNTVFSRFANEDRIEIGDIDVDISPSQRILVYNHIIETFGAENTAYILAIGTISDKGTIDEIGRALQIPLDVCAQIKDEYEADPDKTREKYPDIFYYFDGLVNTPISQSMHPAGIVVSPVTLPDNYGTFWSDGKRILCINMEEVHEISLVKYDLLGLKNIEIINNTCKYLGIKYPKSHTVNWNDKAVWNDLINSPVGIFQFEGDYAFSLLEGFKPKCVNDLSLANAALRPSGASYRDRLLAREQNHNPSEIIDKLLADNNGYLVFQEDTIKFLKDICGLSGSEADNVRRAIGRKQTDRLQKALPRILEGYCSVSDHERDVAEEEAKQFLQIIEDSSNYQFGYNHSTGYSMIGYVCAYFRYYNPKEFIAAYLNCANNSDDIINGTQLAKQLGITIEDIKFGKSRSVYTIDDVSDSIYKGISSIKFCNSKIADELYELSKKNDYKNNFVALLKDIKQFTSVNSKQLSILTILNFFSDFGKNLYLLNIIEVYDKFSSCKQIKKDKMAELGVTDFLMKKYASKETEKIFKEIDNDGLISELISRIDNESLSVMAQVKYELEYLEYAVYRNSEVNSSYYIVTEFKTFKEIRKPYVTLYNLNTGETVKTKIKQVKVFVEQPFGLYTVLKVDNFAYYNKTKCVAGEWVKTKEMEPILESYEVIKQ